VQASNPDTAGPPRTSADAGPGRRSASRRTERGVATIEAFLDAAVQSLLERGIAGTTIAEIARRAGVSPGLFVRYWPTKAALLAAAAEAAQRNTLARFQDRWNANTPDDLDHLARIRAGIATIVDLYAEPEMRCLAELESAARTDAELAATVLPATESIDNLIIRSARNLAPVEAAAPRFDDSVRVIIDCARGTSQRTAHAPAEVAAATRRDVASALARLVGVAAD
jgi:AcrR family transcriptional regulator